MQVLQLLLFMLLWGTKDYFDQCHPSVFCVMGVNQLSDQIVT